jgi:hypothetical protein
MVCVRALPEPDRGARTRPPYGQHTEAVADKLRQLVVQDSSGGAGTSNLSDAEVVRLAEQATGRDARLPGVYTREDADRIGKAWVAWESNAHLDIAEGPPGPPEP